MDDHASAALLQSAITTLDAIPSSALNTNDDTTTATTTTIPFLSPSLLALPRRRPHPQRPHAQRIAHALFPALPAETALIQYEQQRKRAVAAYRAREQAITDANRLKEAELVALGHDRPDRSRGPWKGQQEDPVEMPRAVPMPVAVGKEEDFRDCFAFLKAGGVVDDDLFDCGEVKINKKDIAININIKPGTEPIHGVPLVEFPRGVIYADGRLDLCKMVVGPDHIDALMDALSHSSSSSSSSPPPHIRHFLLGNNIITNHGARRIARFINAHPSQIQTWYLAGNHIKPSGFHALATALQHSPALTNLWLKRNPLGAECVPDLLALLRSPTHRLRVLDIETCEVGDDGVTALFDGLVTIPHNTLEAIYLNGNGIATHAATSLARFLASPCCKLTHLLLSANPLSDTGALALSRGLATNTTLQVLTLASCGLSSAGVSAICDALASNPLSRLRSLDLSSRFTTADLGQRFNHIADEAVESLRGLVFAGGKGEGGGAGNGPLRFLKLGHVAMSYRGLERLRDAVVDGEKSSLVGFEAARVVKDPTDKEEDNEEDVGGAGAGAGAGDEQKESSNGKAVPNPGTRHAHSHSYSLRVHRALKQNYHRLYASSDNVPYESFVSSTGSSRLLRNHPDVRLIDSVYRTRDKPIMKQGKVRKFWDLERNEVDIVLWRRLDAIA